MDGRCRAKEVICHLSVAYWVRMRRKGKRRKRTVNVQFSFFASTFGKYGDSITAMRMYETIS